jgi:DNA invertase Pin-like site-specific DNA recombinase
MTGKTIGYIRVSTVDQNPERQLEGISLDKKFTDYASGATTKRPQLKAMMDYAREDDHIFVHSMDRLARNVKDLRQIIDDLVIRRVKVQFVKENLIFTGDKSPMSDLLLSIMGAVAEFEHSLIKERQQEGVTIAKKAGKYKGATRKLGPSHLERIKNELKTRKTKTKIAQDLGVSRETFYKYINDNNLWEENE